MPCEIAQPWNFSDDDPCDKGGIKTIYPVLNCTDVSKMDIVEGVLVSLKRKNKQGKFTGKKYRVGTPIKFAE